MEKNKLITAKNCLFCNSHRIKIFYKQGEWKIYKCSSCGYIFTNPYPSPNIIHEFYTFDYFKDERHIQKFFNSDGSLKIAREGEIDYINRIIDIENEFNHRGSLLEIGAAHGQFLYVMKNRGWDVSGIEISRDACKIAHDVYGIELFNGTFLDYLDDKLFDVICMYQTLEHVYQPFEHIEKAYSRLKTGGILVIEVPNVYSFDMLISKKRRWFSYDLPRHLSHFYPQFLKKVLKKYNYKIIRIDRYYPNFVLSISNALQKKLKTNSQKVSDDSNPNMKYKMLQYKQTWKGLLIKKFSNILPGWKFTIIAKKF